MSVPQVQLVTKKQFREMIGTIRETITPPLTLKEVCNRLGIIDYPTFIAYHNGNLKIPDYIVYAVINLYEHIESKGKRGFMCPTCGRPLLSVPEGYIPTLPNVK